MRLLYPSGSLYPSVCSLPVVCLNGSAIWPAKPAPYAAWCWKQLTRRGQCRLHVQPLDSDSQQSAERGGDLELPQELKSFDELTAKDVMSSPAVFATPDAGILEVMEILVAKGISGLPVCSDDGHVLGIVSGYDLLAVDSTPGRLDPSLDATYLFPPVNLCSPYKALLCVERFGGNRHLMWSNFKELRQELEKRKATSVGGIMRDAVTVDADLPLSRAADLIVNKKANRLVVVDTQGRLAGVLSRGDVLRAVINNFNIYMRSMDL